MGGPRGQSSTPGPPLPPVASQTSPESPSLPGPARRPLQQACPSPLQRRWAGRLGHPGPPVPRVALPLEGVQAGAVVPGSAPAQGTHPAQERPPKRSPAVPLCAQVCLTLSPGWPGCSGGARAKEAPWAGSKHQGWGCPKARPPTPSHPPPPPRQPSMGLTGWAQPGGLSGAALEVRVLAKLQLRPCGPHSSSRAHAPSPATSFHGPWWVNLALPDSVKRLGSVGPLVCLLGSL